MSWEAWGDPPEPEDPLEHVEHPRERKPWKRDRDAVRFKMQQRISERLRDNPMIESSRGEFRAITKDHSRRFAQLNMLSGEIFRYRVGIGRGPGRSQRFEALARLWRIAELVRYFDKAPLP